MKLSAAFGVSDQIRIKTFELQGQTLRVRVPRTKDLEEIANKCETIDQAKFAERYQKAIAAFDRNVPVEGIEFTDDDVIVDGRSTKELVQTSMKMENRIVEYVKLLVPVDNGTIDELTYEEIEEEWPFSIQLEILNKISEAIQPGYKDARKNS